MIKGTFRRRRKGSESIDSIGTIEIIGGLPDVEVPEFRFTTPEGKRWRVRGGLPDTPLLDKLSPEQQAANAAEQKLFNDQQLRDIE